MRRSAAVFLRVAEAETMRVKTLSSIYTPAFQGLTETERLKLARSGDIWWKYSRLGERNITLNHSLTSLLKKIDDSASSLKNRHNPLDDDIWKAFRLAMTHHSTAIEGNKLSKDQTAQVIDAFGQRIAIGVGISSTDEIPLSGLDEISKLPVKDVIEVVNHAATMEYLKRHQFFERGRLTIDKIQDLFSILMPSIASFDTLSVSYLEEDHGNFRRMPIKVTGSPTVRPYPHEVPAEMNRILSLYYDHHLRDLHPLVADVLFMMNFLYVHPFPDGNGRISRLLLLCLLYHHNYYGLVIPVGSKKEFFSHFTPYFESNAFEGVVHFVGKEILKFHGDLQFYEDQK